MKKIRSWCSRGTGNELIKLWRIMKIMFFLMWVFILPLSAIVRGQNATVNLSLSQVTVEEVIGRLEKMLDKDFFFEKRKMDTKRLIDVKWENAELDEIVKQIFGVHYSYALIDNMIVITPQLQTLKNEKIIQGIVRNSKGEFIPGVAVIIQGTTLGVATDNQGFFKFTVPKMEETILVFSFVGMEKKVIKWQGEETLEVVMQETVQEMDEVMVTGYQTLPKERVTGAFTFIGSKQLEKIGNFNLKDKIEGLIPGLYFEPNFDEDQNPTEDKSRSIVIRGVSTFGDNNPLIVIDGFPVSNVSDPWASVNPDDVESITVLKDAAAASIWGAQAANGVIVITTKKGEGGITRFDCSVDFMVQPVPDLSKIPWASSKEAVDIYKWMILEKDYLDDLLDDKVYKRYDLPEVIRVLADMKRGSLPATGGNARLEELSRTDVRNEFKKLFFRKMETATKVNLSLQSGTKLNTFRASLTTLINNRYTQGDSRFDILFNMNDQYSPKAWLKFNFGTNLSYSNRKNNGVAVNELKYIPQMSRIMGDKGEYLPMVWQRDYDGYYAAPTGNRQDSVGKYDLPYDWYWNLKREKDNLDNSDKDMNLRLNARLNLLPLEGLNLELSYQYQYINNHHREYYNEDSWTVRNSVNNFAQPDGTYPIPTGGMLYETKRFGYAHNVRAQFIFDRTFQKHAVRLMGGIELRKDYYDQIPYGYYGYDPQALSYNTSINFQDPVPSQMSGIYNSWNANIPVIPGQSWVDIQGRDDRYLSYYGNAGYTYDGKYDVTGSIRLDKTNLYGQGDSYRNLPQWSVGLGWNLAEESFLRFLREKVDYLKFRFSYGWNGNIDKSASPYIYGYQNTDPVTQLPYAAVQTAPNPTLTWEKTKTYNLGLDFAAWSNRLNGSLNVYVKNTEDVLTDMAVNGTYGFYNNRATLNAGDIHNKGVEFDLSALVVDRGVKWRTMLNYSTNQNVAKNITLISNTLSAYTNMAFYYHKPDRPVSYIAAIRSAGYDADGMPQFYYGNEVMSVADVKNYNTLDPAQLFEFVGQRDPKHWGSWTNSITYKGLELSFRFLYKFGHKFIGDYPANNLASTYLSPSTFFTFLPELMVHRWKSPADANSARMYSLENKLSSNQATFLNTVARYNTDNVYNAGSVRLQNISLSYQLPEPVLSTLKLNSVRIAFEARNLGAIIKMNKAGIDPDNPPYSSSQYGALMYVVRNRPEYSLSLRIGF